MKVQKIIRAQGEYAKINTDIKDGDTLVIKDSGQMIPGDWGDRHVFKVETRNGERNLSFNQTSMNNLIDAYGEDTEMWIGKNAAAFVIKQMVGEGLKNVCYLAGEGWTMTDDGKFVGPNAPKRSSGEDNYPYPEAEGIDPSNIPF